MKFRIQEFADGSAVVHVFYDDKYYEHAGIFDSFQEAKEFVMGQLPSNTLVQDVYIGLG